MEPMLRTKLGLPVKLVRGVIELIEDKMVGWWPWPYCLDPNLRARTVHYRACSEFLAIYSSCTPVPG